MAARYEVALGAALFAVDVACLVLVGLVARRAYPEEGPVALAGRMAAYVAATTACGLILYDRQDLVVGLFPLLALAVIAVAGTVSPRTTESEPATVNATWVPATN